MTLWMSGAPQKIMYIAEEAFKKAGIKANIQYHTALPGFRQIVFFTFVMQYIKIAFFRIP